MRQLKWQGRVARKSFGGKTDNHQLYGSLNSTWLAPLRTLEHFFISSNARASFSPFVWHVFFTHHEVHAGLTAAHIYL